jgi:hypothetical protein
VSFKEDSDEAGNASVDASLVDTGQQRLDIKIKQDGQYELYFEVTHIAT